MLRFINVQVGDIAVSRTMTEDVPLSQRMFNAIWNVEWLWHWWLIGFLCFFYVTCMTWWLMCLPEENIAVRVTLFYSFFVFHSSSIFFYGGVTYKVSFKFFSDVALLWQSYRFILNSIGKQTFGFWVSFSFSFSQIFFYARFAALLAANSGMAKFTIFH